MTRALQLHYTSCRRGEGRASGYQVRSSTPGLGPDEKAEIQAHSGYTLPRGISEDPATLPRSLRSYPLCSGRWALTRTVYTGVDHTGRRGNFFAHTLIFEEPPPTWPLDLLFWDGWVDGLDPADDTDDVPPPLPEVDLVEPEPAFPLDVLQEFLGEHAGAEPVVERALRALLHGGERPLVLRDAHDEQREWLAAVHRALPLQVARRLRVSSLQADTQRLGDLNATVHGSSLALDATQRRYQLYAIDLPHGPHSEVPESPEGWPAAAARMLVRDPASLVRWQDRSDNLGAVALHELEPVWELHALLDAGQVPADPASVLALVRRQPAPLRATLVDRLGPHLEALATDPPSRLALARELVAVRPAPWSDPHVRAALAASLADGDDLVTALLAEDHPLDAVVGMLRDVAPRLDAVLARTLDEARWGDLTAVDAHALRRAHFNALSEAERPGVALRWLQQGVDLPDDLRHACPSWANRRVSIVNGDPREAQVVAAAALRAGVELRPNRPALLELLHLARDGRPHDPYAVGEHARTLRGDAEANAWLDQVSDALLRDVDTATATRAWLELPRSPLRSRVLTRLEERLVDLEEADLDEVDRALGGELVAEAHVVEAWTALRQRVTRRRGSLGRRLLRWLGRT